MKRSRFSDAQIIAALKENEAGAKVDELGARKSRVSGDTTSWPGGDMRNWPSADVKGVWMSK